MAVDAHPDDESSKGAATTAKYVAEGAKVLVATCTGGERGSVLNPKMDRPEVVAEIADTARAAAARNRTTDTRPDGGRGGSGASAAGGFRLFSWLPGRGGPPPPPPCPR